MLKRTLLALAVVSAAALAGCAAPTPPNNDVVTRTKAASDTLAALLRARRLDRAPVVVATVVPLEQLTKSTALGMSLTEQVAGRLAYAGVPVVELKLRTAMYVSRDGGEFMLSRELKDLSLEHRAALAVVGTYSVANQDVMVTLKAVDVQTNTVVAAHSYSIPRTLVSKMLN